MEEKKAREIVESYLTTQGVRFIPRKATEAGPDILIEGKAIEVKGTDFPEKGAFDQLSRYVTEYASLTFAFPVDSLTLSLLYGLLLIEHVVKFVKSEKNEIKLMLLLDGRDHSYLKEFGCVEALANEVADAFAEQRLGYDTRPEEIRAKLQNLFGDIEDTIRRLLKDRILRYSTLYAVNPPT